MFQTTDFRKGLKIELEKKVYQIVDFQHVNPGKGSAFVRTRLKNLETGQVLEKTFKAGVDTADKPDLEDKEMEFMYGDHEGFHFMDQTSYETITLGANYVGDAKNYLIEGIRINILYHNEKPIAIDLPNFVSLKVKQTDPGLKGDTASGGNKKAIMETDLQVNVPLFIKEGEVLKIDSRTGDYVERVKN